MKYVITIFMIITIAVQSFSKWIVVFAYEMNKEYVARNLCINRTKPSCCCKGKCFLGKKLAEDDGQQQPAGKFNQQDDGLVELFLHKTAKIDLHLFVPVNQYNSFYLDGKSQEFVSHFFQPPRC